MLQNFSLMFQNFSLKVTVKTIVMGAVAGVLTLLGGWDKIMEVLVIFIVMDYLTGVGMAIKDKKLNSEIGSKGLLKKAGIFFTIILAAQLDKIVDNPANLFRTTAGLFHIANEGISITENIGKLGVKIPKFLIKTLEQLRTNADKDDSEDVEQHG